MTEVKIYLSNEELALKIQQGEQQYYNQLWDNTRKLLYRILHRELYRRILPSYITKEDLRQELYFALCKAVGRYNPDKGYKFNSYLHYAVKNMLASVIPLHFIQETSYNEPAFEDNHNPAEMIDYIPDSENGIEDKIDEIQSNEISETVRAAVSLLPINEKAAIYAHYLQNRTYISIAEQAGCSIELIRQRTNNGLRKLRKNKTLQQLNRELGWHLSGTEGIRETSTLDYFESTEYKTVKKDIHQPRENGKPLTWDDEKAVMMSAYRNYLDNLKETIKLTKSKGFV